MIPVFVQVKPDKYEVWVNGKSKYIGDAIMCEDGYFNFFPELASGGYWPPFLLRFIADKLDEINAPWNKTVNDYFNDKQQTLSATSTDH
jgi:hypothetical protein